MADASIARPRPLFRDLPTVDRLFLLALAVACLCVCVAVGMQ